MSGFTILALVFVLYALLAGRLDRFSITAPMVFVAVSGLLGPGATDLLQVSCSNESPMAITEITLSLLLFAEASTLRFRDLEGDASLPSRLLFRMRTRALTRDPAHPGYRVDAQRAIDPPEAVDPGGEHG